MDEGADKAVERKARGMRHFMGPLQTWNGNMWRVSIEQDDAVPVICLSCWDLVGVLPPPTSEIKEIRLIVDGKVVVFLPEKFRELKMQCPHCGGRDLAKVVPLC